MATINPNNFSKDTAIHRSTFITNGDEFVILNGPPYANGKLHVGHARNMLLKDFIARAYSINNNVQWDAGFDCHGLPIERQIEDKVSKEKPVDFISAARKYAAEQVAIQQLDMNYLGTSINQDKKYLTMNPKQEANTLRVFADILEAGNVYSRYKPVHWCTSCKSTVSLLEQEDGEINNQDLYFPVTMNDGNKFIVWTTQAWSLHFHDNVFVNPNASYSLLNTEHGNVFVATQCIENVVSKLNITNYSVLGIAIGSSFVGKEYTLLGKTFCIRADEYVRENAGTGFLHASAACSEEDFAVLGNSAPSLTNGTMDESGMIGSVFYKKLHTSTIDLFKDDPLSVVVSIKKAVAVCWRHKIALTIRPSLQWYVNIDAVRDTAMNMIEQVKFIPDGGKNRLASAVQSRPDWCVSRQRLWGVPLSIYHKNGMIAPDAVARMRNIADDIENNGVEVIHHYKDDGEYTLCKDVLDVWFDSGCCFLTTTDKEVDIVVEGHDQHRGWFQSSLWVAALTGNKLPYKTVVTHGFVNASEGVKFSKSAGKSFDFTKHNGKELNPDVIRLMMLSYSVKTDVVYSPELIKTAQSDFMKLKNTLAFIISNTSGFDSSKVTGMSDMSEWALYKATAYVSQIKKLATQVNCDGAYKKLFEFVNGPVSSVFFNGLKENLYCGNSVQRANAQAALLSLWAIIKDVLSVFVPGLVEHASQYINNAYNSYNYCDAKEHWGIFEEWKQRFTKEWSLVSDMKLEWASLTIPNHFGLTFSELKEWFTASAYNVGEFAVEKINGTWCNECYMVFTTETCNHCEDRNV